MKMPSLDGMRAKSRVSMGRAGERAGLGLVAGPRVHDRNGLLQGPLCQQVHFIFLGQVIETEERAAIIAVLAFHVMWPTLR